MNKSIQIGPHKFPSRSAAKNHCRAIMRRHVERGIMSGADEVFLRDLIALHPEAEHKIGCGISGFTTQIDPIWKTTRHFVILRMDGSSTDFSFHTCIDGNNHRKDVLAALRHAVSDQIVNFVRCSFALDRDYFCPYTGEQLSIVDCHVDHIPPDTFLNLVSRWMEQENLRYDQIQLVDNADNQWVRELKDAAQYSSWHRFHIVNCNLRLVSAVANLSHIRLETAK